MNRRWNQTRSEAIHQRLKANPDEWSDYHSLYRKARKEWSLIPNDEVSRWCRNRSGYTIGDFGCGEATLGEELSDRHTVYSFDHVAVNDSATCSDITHSVEFLAGDAINLRAIPVDGPRQTRMRWTAKFTAASS